MPYSEDQINTLEIINYTTESLSIVGSLIIILNCTFFKTLRDSFAYNLVLYLAVADLIRSIGKFMGSFLSSDYKWQFECTLGGFMVTFGGLSSFLLIAVIAICLYTMIKIKYAPIWKVTQHQLRLRSFYIALTVFGISLIMSCLPFSQNAYGYVGAWCWISNKGVHFHHWRWLCYYGPLQPVIILSIIVYAMIFYELKQFTKTSKLKSKSDDLLKMYQKLKYFPAILLISFAFPTIRRFYQVFEPEAPFWLGLLHTIGSGSYGFLNAVLYGINPGVIREYKKIFRRIGCPFVNEDEEDESNLKIEMDGSMFQEMEVESPASSSTNLWK